MDDIVQERKARLSRNVNRDENDCSVLGVNEVRVGQTTAEFNLRWKHLILCQKSIMNL